MDPAHQTSPLNANTRYQKQALHSEILKYLSRRTNYVQKRIEKTDRQTFFNISSERSKALKTSISYSKALRIKKIC